MKFNLRSIVQPHENFKGLSYGNWTSIWWNWLFSDQVQYGSIHFLRGNTDKEDPIIRTGVNSPVIYSGTTIFFPIICTISSKLLFEHASTQMIRRRESAERQKIPVLLNVEINRVRIPNLKNYYVESPEFVLEIPKTSKVRRLTDPPARIGKSPAVSAGYWIMLRPLPPGSHKIIFEGKHADGFRSYGEYTVKVLIPPIDKAL